MTATPLMDRIRETEQRNLRYLYPAPPTPIRRPRWLARLEAKDLTESIYSDGAYVPAGDRGAA